MTREAGRNDPCPCGSGRKFKACCLHRSRTQESGGRQLSEATVLRGEQESARFRFEPGSYGGPAGYFPSVACLRQDRGRRWHYHFVLVVPDEVYDEEETASSQAGQHLFKAFGGRPSPEAIAERLKNIGYVSVSDFRVVPDSEAERGFLPAATDTPH